MSDFIPTPKLYTYKVVKGEFKGKIVKSFDSNTFIFGINGPWIDCIDDEGNEYCIFYSNLKAVAESEE